MMQLVPEAEAPHVIYVQPAPAAKATATSPIKHRPPILTQTPPLPTRPPLRAAPIDAKLERTWNDLQDVMAGRPPSSPEGKAQTAKIHDAVATAFGLWLIFAIIGSAIGGIIAGFLGYIGLRIGIYFFGPLPVTARSAKADSPTNETGANDFLRALSHEHDARNG